MRYTNNDELKQKAGLFTCGIAQKHEDGSLTDNEISLMSTDKLVGLAYTDPIKRDGIVEELYTCVYKDDFRKTDDKYWGVCRAWICLNTRLKFDNKLNELMQNSPISQTKQHELLKAGFVLARVELGDTPEIAEQKFNNFKYSKLFDIPIPVVAVDNLSK